MRKLILLRGSAGCGKSTWIESKGLKPFTLSADDIRLQVQAPVLNPNGTIGISQTNDNQVWDILFTLLEKRMARGDFTVVDATNSKTSEMSRYKELAASYRYRIVLVDFTDIPIEEVKRRNSARSPFKRVPDEVIDKMYARFATQKVPSGIKVITPAEFDDEFAFKPLNLTEKYKKIHVIGDIHGCNTALQQYFSDNGGMKDDELYIFAGDYIDRGAENAETLKFILSVHKKENVFLVEGNHERHLWLWSNDCQAHSKEFEFVTKPELEAANISKKDVRQMYRHLCQCAYFKYGSKEYLVTHGGISFLPGNLTVVATSQMINGVGKYEECCFSDESFVKNAPANVIQIHGHRNIEKNPIAVNDRIYNLEGAVEFGGELRTIQITADGIDTFTVKNTVVRTKDQQKEVKKVKNSSVADAIMELRNSSYVREKKIGNISSFNFSKDAFYKGAWDEQTITARGLYIDTVKAKVVARAYPKFFNVNERTNTQIGMLGNRLKFPVTAYVKENGYLGIVSYNEYTDDLFITTKSSPEGPFAVWLKEMLQKKLTPEQLKNLKEYVKENNVSFVFECVDMEHDPHIIDYPENHLFLLDIISNDIEFKKYDYGTLCQTAKDMGMEVKEKAYTFQNWQEFLSWYNEVIAEDYKYHGRYIEGFVVEDSNQYMIKVKGDYYHYWKFMRSLTAEVAKYGNTRKTGKLITPFDNFYLKWLKELYVNDPELLSKNICTLRKLFLAQYKNAANEAMVKTD